MDFNRSETVDHCGPTGNRTSLSPSGLHYKGKAIVPCSEQHAAMQKQRAK
jgi:hypothetical protein